MEFAKMQRGYTNLWAAASIKPSLKSNVMAIARGLLKNRARYQKISDSTRGVPWWWIAAIHHMEKSGDFNTYLGNGQSLYKKTTIVPKGRGPFKTFEEGAIDAIKLHDLHRVPAWDIPRALYEAERYNGWGYLGRTYSPYVWSFTNLYTRGKFTEDHVWNPNAVSKQCGVAALWKAFEELGVLNLKPAVGETMTELKASLAPFGTLAPVLITTLAGPAASLALRALSEAFSDDESERPAADPKAIQEKLEELPLRALPQILVAAEDLLNALIPPAPVVSQAEPVPPVLMPVTDAVPPVTPAPAPAPTVVLVPEKAPELGIVDRIFGGQMLAGLKTPLGILIYCAAWAFGPGALNYITPEAQSALFAFATALAGIGITAKVDRVLPWLSRLSAVVRR